MANKERENFYRGSTLILDNTKTSFVDLLELHLSLKNISFEDFIDLHQHEIYHLSYGTRGTCCQCTTGYVLPPKCVLYLVQLEIIFDQYKKKPCHHSGTKGDYCCAEPKSGIKTDTLDITLIRVLLVNFCQDVFWYSCLDLPSQSFEDFLNKNKHHIYHLRERNMQCCQCPLGYIFPKTDRLQSLGLDEWRLMFNLPVLPCPLHRISPSDLICTVSAPSGIDVSDLGYNLTKLILEQCCPLRNAIDILIGIRNTYIGHASVGRISDANFEVFKSNIESGIMEIARVCENEVLTKQSFSDVFKRPLDETLCIQYQNMLLEKIVKENRLEEVTYILCIIVLILSLKY